MAGVVQW